MAKHVYHWKHGWIPLTHTAAMSKAKGNKKAAAKMLDAVHGDHLKRDSHVTVGHRDGTVVVHDRKTGNVHKMGADEAKKLHESGRHITGVKADGSLEHRDVKGPDGPTMMTTVPARMVKDGDILHQPSAMGGKTKRLRVDKAYPPKGDGGRNVDVTDLETGRKLELTLPQGSKHNIETARPSDAKIAQSARGTSNGRPGADTGTTAGMPDGYKLKRDYIDGYGPANTYSAHDPSGRVVGRSLPSEAAARKAAHQHAERTKAAEAERVATQQRLKAERQAKEAKDAQTMAAGRAAAAALPSEADVARQVATNHLTERMHNNGPAGMSLQELTQIAGADHVAAPARKRAQDELNRQALMRVSHMPGAGDPRAVQARLTDARSMPAGPMKDALIHALEEQLKKL